MRAILKLAIPVLASVTASALAFLELRRQRRLSSRRTRRLRGPQREAAADGTQESRSMLAANVQEVPE